MCGRLTCPTHLLLSTCISRHVKNERMRRKSIGFACVLITIALIMNTAVPEVVGQGLTLQTVASLYRPVSVTLASSGLILSYRYNDTSMMLASLNSNGMVSPFAPNFSGSQ